MTKTYTGERWLDDVHVRVDGLDLPSRQDLKRFSKNGFEWGYEDSEPAQLALAILADHLQDDTLALRYYDPYMCDVVSFFLNDWMVSSDEITRALESMPEFVDTK